MGGRCVGEEAGSFLFVCNFAIGLGGRSAGQAADLFPLFLPPFGFGSCMRLPEYQTEVKAIGLWGKWPCAIALRPSDLVCACAKRGLKYKDKSQKAALAV